MSKKHEEEDVIPSDLVKPVERFCVQNSEKSVCEEEIQVEPPIQNEKLNEEITKKTSSNDILHLNTTIEMNDALKCKKDITEDTTEHKMESEMDMYDVIEPVKCELCSQSFSLSTELTSHQETCGSIQTYTCSICSGSFISERQFHDHVCTYEEKTSSCKQCKVIFTSKKQFEKHACQKLQIVRRCNICGLEFTRLSSLKNHVKIHTHQPGRDLFVPAFCETILPDNPEWSNDIQTYLPSMSQLDVPNNPGVPNWNAHLNLNDSLENKDVQDPLDYSQEMAPSGSYPSILEHQPTFQEFENIDEISVHSDSIELKQQSDLYLHSNRHADERENHTSDGVTSIDLHANFITNDATPKKPHRCKYCGVAFTREKALISHERFHQDHLTDILECKKCSEIFLNKEDLKSHHCSKVPHKTHINTYHLTTPRVNAESVQSNRAYEMENIEYNEENYTNPLDPSTDKQNKHTCEHCFKRFTTKQKKFRHMWIHRNKTFSCEVCADSFSTQDQLNEHRLASHEGNTPHGCVICGKCFASRQGLWEHMRLHKEGSAPHQCSLCGKTFTSRQGYHIHARTHTGERPYGCRYCWKAFRDGGTLRKHERIHTGERPHVCPICHRAFNQKVVLREHVRWLHAHHHPDRNQPFIPCPIPNCQHTLTDKEDLCAHIVKHSDTLSGVDQSTANLQPVEIKVKPKPLKRLVKKTSLLLKHSKMLSNNEDDMCVEMSSDHHCDLCGETFPHRELLLSHIKIHI